MPNMNVQKANENSFFGKNMTFKIIFSNFLQNFEKSPADLNSGCAVHKTNALDH